MANLFACLHSTADALSVYSQALEVTQNNTVNASTPGWARQTQILEAMPSDPAIGLVGGVRAGAVVSARDEYAERAVRTQVSLEGKVSQDVTSLSNLQTSFDVSGNSGIPYALNNLLQSFSAWAQTPTDSNARQLVIDRASDLAGAFRQTATNLGRIQADTDQQLTQTKDQVNELTGRLQSFNKLIMAGQKNDEGLDAEIHSTLEQLAQYVNFSTIQESNGTTTVLLAGQMPLLVDDRQYPIDVQQYQPNDAAVTNPTGPTLSRLIAYDGSDITKEATGGQLGSLLNFRDVTLASYIGDAYQNGDLNTMAQTIASRINGLLQSGNISDANAALGTDAVPGIALFTFDTVNPTNAALSLNIDPTVTADKLAAILPAAADGSTAEVANGIALALSNLATPQSASDQINGLSYSQYYGLMASRLGNRLNAATNDQQVQQAAVAQAQNLRQQSSGVSLDEEAMTLVQFQRAYEANSRFFTVLNQLTQDAVNLIST
jgi:flagellar hook-associated protein 1 FlgK